MPTCGYHKTLGSFEMIYKCAKCKFFFERKNEPSKCPSCENQYVVGASKKEQEAFTQMHGKQKNVGSHSDVHIKNPNHTC